MEEDFDLDVDDDRVCFWCRTTPVWQRLVDLSAIIHEKGIISMFELLFPKAEEEIATDVEDISVDETES